VNRSRGRRLKKMHNGGKIIAGLIIFIGIITFPIWRNVARGEAPAIPDPKITTGETECVAPLEYMRANHMALLNEWRDLVVRGGDRIYVGFNGKHHYMSLTETCMNCHSNKAEFCDQCHDYVGAKPYCWDCHLEPKESN
jgi:hypothetical protein